MFLSVPDTGKTNLDDSFAEQPSSRLAQVAYMNELYMEEELAEAIETTDALIANVRERKNALFKELAEYNN